MAVPPEVVDEIRNRVDIVRLIGEVVPLKKTGRNFVGLCPFHSEKSPSFSVSDDKQLYYCFGCGEGGTVFTFFMKFHRLTFPETLERLAPQAGIDLRQYQQESKALVAKKEERRKMIRAMTYARDFYHQVLMESPSAQLAREYAKSRGISPEAVQKLKLGYAPGSWQSLTDLFQKHQFPMADAQKAGLVIKKSGENRYYDLFRDRLLFPITDPKGNTVGFGGRVLKDGTPKYLNSPQSPIFDKGSLLFGLHEAGNSLREKKYAILVEGYMDQVALSLSGILNVVATLGTALTEAHVRLLRKYVDEVVLVFDGDDAGLKAARRSVRSLLPQGVRSKVVLLPMQEDPDTYVQKNGKAAFLKLVSSAESLLDFFLRRFVVEERDVSKKAEATSEMAQVITMAESEFLKEALADEASKRTGIKREVFRGEEKLLSSAVRAPLKEDKGKVSTAIPIELLTLLRIAAENEDARQKLLESNLLETYAEPELCSIAQKWLAEIQESTEMGAAALIDLWEDDETRSLLAKVFLENSFPSQLKWQQMWEDCLKKLQMREIRKLSKEVAQADQKGESDNVMKLMRKMEELRRKHEGR